jgi:hypothetical protein
MPEGPAILRHQLIEPTDAQVLLGISAAEKESAAWKIEQKEEGGLWIVSDVNRMIAPGAMPQPITVRKFADVERARRLVKWHVWRAGIKAVLNA